MFSEDVTTKNGVIKHVVANSQEELDEAVKAVKAEYQAPAPDIHDPKDGNKIVSPDNLPVEPIPSVVDNSVDPEVPEEPKEEEKVDDKSKEKSKKTSNPKK